MKEQINNKNPLLGKIFRIAIYMGVIAITISTSYYVENIESGMMKIMTFLCPLLIELGIVVFNVQLDRNRDKKKGEAIEKLTLPESVMLLVQDGIEAYKTKPAVKVMMVLLSAIAIGAAAGNADICGRAYAFISYDGEEQDEPVDDAERDEEETEEELPELDSEDEEWFGKQDFELISQVEGITISKVDLEKESELAIEDRDKIFFIGGDFVVGNWDDQDEVTSKVRAYVWSRINQQQENVFDKPVNDGGADEDIKETVARISREEREIKSFAERKDNMLVRGDIFRYYPKGSLANLRSNDAHFLALVLYRNGGNEVSIEYYYGKSIEYRMDRISFKDISKDHIKSELEWTSMRYADIVYTCPDSPEKEYALKLQKAFTEVANEF